MKKVLFLVLCFLILTVSLWAVTRTREVARYLVPEGATEVAIVEITEHHGMEDRIKERPHTYYKHDYDMLDIPPHTTIIFYDKNGNELEAKIRPPASHHINLDNIPLPQKQ